ncbi:MAG: hypothetical protein J7577_13460 [Sphingobacteriaceae bacterium]|nr:hypothetical protein [Sphingobacteriaceae bacterium]
MENHQLHPNDLSTAQTLMQVFKERYKDKSNAVKTEDLIFHLKASGVENISPQSLRRILGHIRNNDLIKPYFILSNVHCGYWLSKDTKELNSFLDQELNRMSNQFTNIEALHQRLRGKKPPINTSQTILF